MIIFDLEGVLADDSHRRHFIEPYEKKWVNEEEYFGPEFKGQSGYQCFNKDGTLFQKTDYRAYYDACDKDKPILPVMEILIRIAESEEYGTIDPDADYTFIHIWSGRCESVRKKTENWLKIYLPKFRKENLKMRPRGNTDPTHILKEKWFCEERLICKDTQMIDFVFDADPESIAMWRRRGVFCFDCRQG